MQETWHSFENEGVVQEVGCWDVQQREGAEFGGLEVGCWDVQQREGAERLVG